MFILLCVITIICTFYVTGKQEMAEFKIYCKYKNLYNSISCIKIIIIKIKQECPLKIDVKSAEKCFQNRIHA